MNEADLILFLSEQVKAKWKHDKSPYMLSSVAVDLAKKNQDYKSAIGEERLKDGVSRFADSADFKVVRHPFQKAKIGLVPKDEVFEFDLKSKKASVEKDKNGGTPNAEKVLLDFLRVIRTLPDELTKEVMMPLSVLARFVSKK